MSRSFAFSACLWVQAGPAAWHFVTVPQDVSDDIADAAGPRTAFGSVPVRATLGAAEWSTSLFPDKGSGCYVLPVKKSVRLAEGVGEGDQVRLILTVFG